MPLPRHPDGSFWYEKWLGTALAFDGYQLLRPVRPTPGGLTIVVPKARLKEVSELMRDPGMKHWEIRGVIGQQQFLPSTLPTHQGSLIKGRNKTWISTIGSKSAGGFTQFMVHADAEENVTDICYGSPTQIRSLLWRKRENPWKKFSTNMPLLSLQKCFCHLGLTLRSMSALNCF